MGQTRRFLIGDSVAHDATGGV